MLPSSGPMPCRQETQDIRVVTSVNALDASAHKTPVDFFTSWVQSVIRPHTQRELRQTWLVQDYVKHIAAV